MGKNRALSKRPYDEFGTPVQKHDLNKNRQEKVDITKENTFYPSSKGIFEKGFYNGDPLRKIPKIELTVFNDVQSLKRGNINAEDLQFDNTRGFALIDSVVRAKGFMTLEEAEASFPEILKEVTQKMPNEMKDELERKISFIIYTREWNDTPSDSEVSDILDELRDRQMRIINNKWDDAIEARGKRVKFSPEEKECKNKIELLENAPCGRILGGDVTIAEYESLEKLLKTAGITKEPGMGISLSRAEGTESEIWAGMSGTQEKDSLFIEEEQ